MSAPIKHAPGPWRVSAGNLVRVMARGSDRPICGVHRRGRYSFDEVQAETLANARLIAAAPELLAALQAVVRVADRATIEFDAARRAIAKATGP